MLHLREQFPPVLDEKKTVCSECGWTFNEAQRINMEKWALIGAIICTVIAIVSQGISWYIMLDRFGYKAIPVRSYVIGGVRLLLCCATVVLMFCYTKISEVKRNKGLFKK